MSFSAGTFTINTTGQPVVVGTTISASVFNSFTSDIATGLSTCMLKDGTQTATAGIGFFAGTVSLPGITFGTDTATGFYRIGLNNTGFAINGTKLLDLSAALVGITGALTVSTTANIAGAVTLQSTLAVTGNSTLTGTLALGTSGMTVTGSATSWGLSVTPNTWTLGKAIEIGNTGSGVSSLGTADVRLSSNYYYNTGDKFAGSGGSDYASSYLLVSGFHQWRTSSGTGAAGVGATMNTLMTLNPTGDLSFDFGGYIALVERTAPAGGGNQARLFAVDNGSGKTVLKVQFATGAAQTIATEP